MAEGWMGGGGEIEAKEGEMRQQWHGLWADCDGDPGRVGFGVNSGC